jgi:hypothetical protein
MVQINDDYYEDLDYEGMATLLDKLKDDDVPPAGSIKGRQGSQPEPGPTSLSSVTPFPGTTKKAAKSARKGG